jgi:type IV pilus assembly protein PilY1
MDMAAGYLFFNTLIPNSNVCGAGGGGRTCAVNAATGLTSGDSCGLSTVGLLSSPIIVEEGAGAYSATDGTGRRSEKKRLSVVNLGTGSGNGSPGVEIAKPTGNNGVVTSVAARLTWRQVPNYKDAKAKANP